MAWGAGQARTSGEAEARAIRLAAGLLEELGRSAIVYSDSREAVAAAQGALAGRTAVTAVRWTARERNRAADTLSRLGRQAWQGVRRRGSGPRPGSWRAAPPPPPPPVHRAGPPPPAAGAPRTLEEAIVALAHAGSVPARAVAGRIEAHWPDLLALRGRPESSVRDALDSVVRRGEVVVDGGESACLLPGPGEPAPPAVLAALRGRLPRRPEMAGRLPAPRRQALARWLRADGVEPVLVLADALAPVLRERPDRAAGLVGAGRVVDTVRTLCGDTRAWRVLAQGDRAVAVIRRGLAAPATMRDLLTRLGFTDVAPPARPVQAWPWLARRLAVLDPAQAQRAEDLVAYGPGGPRRGRALWLRDRHRAAAETAQAVRRDARRRARVERAALAARLQAEGASRRDLGLSPTLAPLPEPLATRLCRLGEARDLLWLDAALVRMLLGARALEGVAVGGRTYVTARSVAACRAHRPRLLEGLEDQRLGTRQAAALLAVAPRWLPDLVPVAAGHALREPSRRYRRGDVEAVRRRLMAAVAGDAEAGADRPAVRSP